MKRAKIVVTSIIASLGVSMSVSSSPVADNKIYRYVITETAGPTSLDPLDADSTNNLPVARMIYASPLEITEANQLSSHVLETFRYDSTSRTIEWVVKSGLKFDDGTAITAEDVAFAVARMAHARPQFPVVENIVGLNTWLKSGHPLKSFPSGVEVKGQTISIKLSSSTDHPLFRFCLELFSIIPKRCVNLETGKITCPDIPESGYYRIAERSSDSILLIKRDETKIAGIKAPAKIRFEYIGAEELQQKVDILDNMTVFAGNESMYSEAARQKIENSFLTRYTPASRFSVLLLNPAVAPFKNKKCRQYFAGQFRQSYSEIAGKSQPLEASIFTKILPGYLSVKDLEKESTLSDKEVRECKAAFANTKISWGYPDNEKHSTFIDALKQTLTKVGVKTTDPIVVTDRKEMADQFVAGKISVMNGSSGFWALDPAGDMKMLFTPDLHKALKFVSGDVKLQEMISELSGGQSAYSKINKYLHEEATFNVYSHLRRFYASPNKNLLVDVPFAITSPAPWQVFRIN